MTVDATGYVLGLLTLGMSMVAAKYRNMLLTLGTAALWIVFLNFMLANQVAGLAWLEILIIASITFIAAYALIFLVSRRSTAETGYFGIVERKKEPEKTEEIKETGTETIDEYRMRVRRALHPNRRRRE